MKNRGSQKQSSGKDSQEEAAVARAASDSGYKDEEPDLPEEDDGSGEEADQIITAGYVNHSQPYRSEILTGTREALYSYAKDKMKEMEAARKNAAKDLVRGDE